MTKAFKIAASAALFFGMVVPAFASDAALRPRTVVRRHSKGSRSMKSIVIFVLIILFMALPVRLAAHWFKAERGTWMRSIGVLFLGTLLVNLAQSFLPTSFTAHASARFLISLFILTVVSQVLLSIKAWQAFVLALFLSVLYTFGGGAFGSMNISIGI